MLCQILLKIDNLELPSHRPTVIHLLIYSNKIRDFFSFWLTGKMLFNLLLNVNKSFFTIHNLPPLVVVLYSSPSGMMVRVFNFTPYICCLFEVFVLCFICVIAGFKAEVALSHVTNENLTYNFQKKPKTYLCSFHPYFSRWLELP